MENGASSYRCCLKGDESGLREIIELYSHSLTLFINDMVNNFAVAEDLTAETFFKLIVKRPSFRGESQFKTYLFKIGRNCAVDYLRKQKRSNTCSVEDVAQLAADTASLEAEVLADERNAALHAALLKLNSDYAEVLYLIYFEGMSNLEAARVMNKRSKQIENLVYRAKQSLKNQLERDGFKHEEL